MKVELIDEDKEFWGNMEEKLKMFYFDCLLPEIIDSRLDRQMEIKDTDYILDAVNQRKIAKSEVTKRKCNDDETKTKRKKVKLMQNN